jgi:hypothetical protein
MALFLLGLPEPQKVPCTVNVAALELRRSQIQIASRAKEIIRGEIDIALHVTALGTAALAREPDTIHADRIT